MNDSVESNSNKSSSLNSGSDLSYDNRAHVDLDKTIDLWIKQSPVKPKFSLWGTVDRWGPGAVVILTLILVAIIGWLYSARLSSIESDIRNLRDNQNYIIQRLNIKDMKDQVLREGLIKKGVID